MVDSHTQRGNPLQSVVKKGNYQIRLKWKVMVYFLIGRIGKIFG